MLVRRARASHRATCHASPHTFLARDCYDFEATIAHEVGHVLGFHPPDQFPDANLRAARDADGVAPLPMDNASCWAPLQQVELGALPSGADTIMHSTTKHRDRTCLSTDDLEGLSFLYPVSAHHTPQLMAC